jgi:hypothetical protein
MLLPHRETGSNHLRIVQVVWLELPGQQKVKYGVVR